MTDSNELRGSLRKAFLHYNPQAAWNGREIGELIEGVLSAIPTSGGVKGSDLTWLLAQIDEFDIAPDDLPRFRRLSALSAVPGRIDLEAFSSVACGLSPVSLPVCLGGDATPSEDAE